MVDVFQFSHIIPILKSYTLVKINERINYKLL